MKKLATYALIGLAATSLVACIDDDDDDDNSSSTTTSTTLEGTAATGAAISNEQITAKCADGSGFLSTVTTDSSGEWSGQVASGVLPCALQINSTALGSMIYSFAEASGTVNITPLTNMVVARAVSMSPEDWFGGDSIVIDPAAFNDAKTSLVDSLTAAGFTLPSGDLVTTDFDIGDDWDQVLDDLSASINGSSAFSNYAQLLTTFLEGNSVLPTFVDASGGTGGTDTDSGTDTGGDTDSGTDSGTDTGGSTDSGSDGSGNYDLQLSVTVSNLGSPVVTTLENVAKPANQDQFCSVEQYEQFQNTGDGGTYTWEIVSCSFSGNEGNIQAKATISVSGFDSTLDYSVNYLYTPK